MPRTLLLILGLWLVLAGPVPAAGQPDLVLPDLDGGEHRLSDYRGKWVLVNYWATWCPPCRKELPELEIFHANSEGKAVVLAINFEDIEPARLRSFVAARFLSFPVLLGGSSLESAERVGPVHALPTSYLVSPAGKVVARQEGGVTATGIRDFIRAYESNKAG